MSIKTKTNTKNYNIFSISIFYIISLYKYIKYQSIKKKIHKIILQITNIKQFTKKITITTTKLHFFNHHIY